MTKKLVALVLALVMLVSVAATALAADAEGESAFLSSLDMTVAEINADDNSRALGTWFAILDAMTVLNVNLDDVDLSQDTYIGTYSIGGALDVYLPSKSGGFYNVLWRADSNVVVLYIFSALSDPTTLDTTSVVKNNPETMLSVGQMIVDIISGDN